MPESFSPEPGYEPESFSPEPGYDPESFSPEPGPPPYFAFTFSSLTAMMDAETVLI